MIAATERPVVVRGCGCWGLWNLLSNIVGCCLFVEARWRQVYDVPKNFLTAQRWWAIVYERHATSATKSIGKGHIIII